MTNDGVATRGQKETQQELAKMQMEMQALERRVRSQLDGFRDEIKSDVRSELKSFLDEFLGRGVLGPQPVVTSSEGSSPLPGRPDWNRAYKLKCPKFDGTAFKDWRVKIEQYFEAEGVPATAKVRQVMLQLEGRALHWHQYFVRDRGSLDSIPWDIYLTHMEARFAPRQFEDPMAELVNLKQTGSVEAFHEQFVSIFNQLFLSDSYGLSIFTNNLKPEISQYLKLLRPKDLLEAFHLAKQVELIESSGVRKPFSSFSNSRFGGTPGGTPSVAFPAKSSGSVGREMSSSVSSVGSKSTARLPSQYLTRISLVNKRQAWIGIAQQLERETENVRKRSQQLNLDRLTGLDDAILLRILSKIPFESALRTSTLSKRFRNLWKRIKVVDLHRLPIYENIAGYASITGTLHRIESPTILSFNVIGHINDGYLSEVRHWLDFALSKKVRRLRIGLMSISTLMTHYQLLPYPLLTDCNCTKHLEVLFLNGVEFMPSPAAFYHSGYSQLTRLSLFNCKLKDIIVSVILRQCSVLKKLILDLCTGLRTVSIVGSNLKLKKLTFRWPEYDDNVVRQLTVGARNLKTLYYSGELTKLVLTDCEGLETVILHWKKEPISDEIIDKMRYLIFEFTAVKILGANFHFLEFVGREYYAKGMPYSTFQRLEDLYWFDSPKTPNDNHNLVAFLGDCPSLKFLNIDLREEHWSSFCEIICENNVEDEFKADEMAADGFRCLYDGRYMEKLKTVYVLCFSGFRGELMLLRLILEKAVKLEKLVICWRQDQLSPMNDNVLQIFVETGLHHYDMVDKLMEDAESIKETIDAFPTASDNVQIIYKTEWGIYQWGKHFKD